MKNEIYSDSQIRRLKELGFDREGIQKKFTTAEEKNKCFQKIEKDLIRAQRGHLNALLHQKRKTCFQTLRDRIEQALYKEGFTGVTTPTIITKRSLEKMGINSDHPLRDQIFWLNPNQCLRPMLAPNLYSLMQDFSRLNQRPICFFEIGPCFRKESSGACHSNEFTMLNIVEMGSPENDRMQRLMALGKIIMSAAGIDAYQFVDEDSAVYGSTLDIVAGSDCIEVASGAIGPHPLDKEWDVSETWVGIGFGLERLLMVSQKDTSIGRWTKSLFYMDGICLKV